MSARAYTAGTVIPAFVDGGEWAACFGLSWTDLMLYDQAMSGRMIREGGQYLRKLSGTMGVAAGRSEIAARFLESDGEWLFMVDTDMGFERDTVDRMVTSAEQHGVHVLGALCFAQKGDQRRAETSLHASRTRIQPTLYGYAEVSGERGFLPLENYTPDSFQYVDATGAACILIHREALAKVGPDPFRPMLVANALPGGRAREFSEDLSFCARLAGKEIAIGVDTSIKTTHAKGGIFLDEETYRVQRALQAAPPFGDLPWCACGLSPSVPAGRMHKEHCSKSREAVTA
jgi:hypothetical protein